MFRTFLKKIRIFGSNANDKQKIFLILGLIILWIIGTCIDIFLPFNVIFNTIRAGICVFASVIVFGALYLWSIYRASNKRINNESYQTLRQRWSYNERRNLAIILSIFIFFLVILTSHPSYLYTFLNTWVLVCICALITFVRPYRDEYMKIKYNMPDKRDVDFNNAMKEKIKQRKEKLKHLNKKKNNNISKREE